MSYLVYLARGDPLNERYLEQIAAAGFQFHPDDLYYENACCSTAAAQRPGLQRAVRHLWPVDVLIVVGLNALGNCVSDALTTLRAIEREGAATICLAPNRERFSAISGAALIESLELVVDFERVVRTFRGRHSHETASLRGSKSGRPFSMTESDQAQALLALSNGWTVSQVARNFNTSRQTIMRLRRAARGCEHPSDSAPDPASEPSTRVERAEQSVAPVKATL
ncbi:helix-turn-helix domain-containing protein [Caballeronia sp. LZ001]|uniref:recombinase family protein n=1 Tax=Caballeronia sp. LZ001 TaxID=3038553 RepID=UPI00285444CA|nr:helix-turn-helix domain-containing protein [Caballeronia sp. LZ001]MDR5806368.1 recombinase family protein [Caballeronia sp. LZ001]